MRKSLFIVLALFFIMSAAFPQRRALLVGISNYPDQSGWSHISSQNDLDILNDVLVQRGFSVDTLSESDATFNNITDKLRDLSKNVQKGDTLLIHFSAHGQQMLALNDSLEPDGLDESIIPYDACSTYSDLYKGDKHLKDNVLSAFIDSIADAIGDGGLVVVSIDACHSDAMDKGVSDRKGDSAVVRGVHDIFDFGRVLNPDEEDYLRNASQDTVVQIEKNGADVYYISACRSYEKNYECVIDGVGYGSLSYCIYDLLKNNTGDLEMSTVLDSLNLKMKKLGKQHMGTRNTIGYKPVEPRIQRGPIDDGNPTMVEVVKKYWMAFSAMVIVCALLLYLIWKKK